MLNEFALQRLSEFGPPSDNELFLLNNAAGPPAPVARQGVIRSQGEPPEFIYMLLDGWVCSAATLRTGERQIMKVYLPGDLMGMPSVCLREAADSLFALTPAIVRKIPVPKFAGLFADLPDFAGRMFLAAQREQIALMDRLMALGAKPAIGRVASLLLDLHERLSSLGLVRENEFVLRMTQDEIGDYVGLTAVHVNRTFRLLEDQALIGRRLQRIRLLDLEALRSLSGHLSRELDPDCSEMFQRTAAH